MFKHVLVTSTFVALGIASGLAQERQPYQHQEIYDLNASTEIILSLFKRDELHKILVDADADGLDTLIKNMSPAQMAFESEVLSYPGMCALIFSNANDWRKLHDDVIALAQYYPHIKFVKVDVNKLFKIAELAEIESLPAVVFIQDHQEIHRIEPIDIVAVREYTSAIKI